MLSSAQARVWLAVAGAMMPAACAWSQQCGLANFDNLATGTQVTTQYPGVTFSGRVTGGGVAGNPVVYLAGANTSSPSRCLSTIGDGINEFSCDFLRMDFAVAQKLVTFTVGTRFGCTANDTCRVRWFNAAGTLLGFRDVRVNGAVFDTCTTFVRIGSATGAANIARIEVEHGVNPTCACAFELIDDLVYDTDLTPPIAIMSTPGDRGCVCEASTVTVRGTSNDPDGVFDHDRLEYSRTSDGPWTLVGSFTSPAPGPDTFLYNWDTTGLSGWYHLRLTTTNECGLSTAYENEVFVDATAPSVVVRTPGAGAIVGGTMCLDGTVSDDCSMGGYTIMYRPTAGGVFAAVDPATPTYSGSVINDPIGSWNTRSGPTAVADGAYTVRVQAADSCGHSSSALRNVFVDNTAPVAVITNPVSCSREARGLITIRGTAADANMSGWALQYTGGDAHGWVTIATGTSNITNGVLGVWDARTLRECCYVIRLIVRDQANVSCTGSGNTTETTVAFDLGGSCTQDYNGDGLVNSQDYFDFLSVFFGGCP